MSRAKMLVALTAALSLGFAQEVRVDYKHACNFSDYKTYRWEQPQQAQSSNALFPNQLMRERIVGAVEEALGAKGFKRVEKGEDLLVSYDMRLNPQQRFNTHTDATEPGWGWGGVGCCGWDGGWASSFSTTDTETVVMGTLVVSLKDARHDQLVFQGVSTATVSSRAEKTTKRLRKGINQIFEKYPPKE